MPKKLFSAVTIFVILLGFYFFINIFYLKTRTPQSASHKKIIANRSEEAELMILPNPLVVTASQSATVNILISDSLSQAGTKTIQLELSFDPSLIYNVNIYPGGYFIEPAEIIKHIDFKNGRISYILKGAVQNPNNTVASISFNTTNYSLQRETQIQFLPKTLIKQDFEEIELNKTRGATIIVKPAFFQYAPTASTSPILR